MYSVQIMTNLIFLHGLLGTKSDWQKVIENLPHFRCLSLDLPFHGENKAVAVEDFEQTAQFLESQIQSLIRDEPYILIGYSLGGRIAQYYALHAQVQRGNLQAVILEGANLGLQSEQEKQSRLVNDKIAKQPDFREKVRSSLLPFFYFCGERDQKFRQMAEDNQLDLTLIPHAGHNAHLENSTCFAKKIEDIILKIANS